LNSHLQQHPWQSRIAAFIRSLPDSGRRKRWRVIAQLAASSVPANPRRAAGPQAGGVIAENARLGADQDR
jgi:hypothetical protein